jgi:Flp pilus assembly protein TadD
MWRLIQLLLIPLAVSACTSQSAPRSPEIGRGGSAPAAGFATPEEALKLAFSLRGAGADDQALQVLAAAHRAYPARQAILSAYGRQALVVGEEELAVRLLKRAIAADASDWRAVSALAVLEGQAGRAADARAGFMKAHSLSGGSLAVLNNLGVSEMLDGNAEEAARLLRKALALPGVRKDHAERVKHNLAVALAMTGDFAAAERLAGHRLPRHLEGASGSEAAGFMGLAHPLPGEAGGWAARLARASEPRGDLVR